MKIKLLVSKCCDAQVMREYDSNGIWDTQLGQYVCSYNKCCHCGKMCDPVMVEVNAELEKEK